MMVQIDAPVHKKIDELEDKATELLEEITYYLTPDTDDKVLCFQASLNELTDTCFKPLLSIVERPQYKSWSDRRVTRLLNLNVLIRDLYRQQKAALEIFNQLKDVRDEVREVQSTLGDALENIQNSRDELNAANSNVYDMEDKAREIAESINKLTGIWTYAVKNCD